ncbi:MAG TPA: hypothetical protein VF228_19560 [Iamia sp.]
MPTTSSPWASPSSPAGRRLLHAEAETVDDIPVLDEATLALGAALVAAAASPGGARRRPSVARRGLAAAALVIAVLGLGASARRDHPVPAAPTAAPAPLALAHAAGSALASDVPPAVAGGEVVVARRLGALVALV